MQTGQPLSQLTLTVLNCLLKLHLQPGHFAPIEKLLRIKVHKAHTVHNPREVLQSSQV